MSEAQLLAYTEALERQLLDAKTRVLELEIALGVEVNSRARDLAEARDLIELLQQDNARLTHEVATLEEALTVSEQDHSATVTYYEDFRVDP